MTQLPISNEKHPEIRRRGKKGKGRRLEVWIGNMADSIFNEIEKRFDSARQGEIAYKNNGEPLYSADALTRKIKPVFLSPEHAVLYRRQEEDKKTTSLRKNNAIPTERPIYDTDRVSGGAYADRF